jgi:uncharacterized protein YbjT (DUF2867 family)
MRILVTGATGYIGGRLVPRLLDAGHQVRCLARSPAKLAQHPWRREVEVVAGDVLHAPSLKEAASGCDIAYYLVHSAAAGKGFASLDRTGADNFRLAAEDAGLRRIVYLGAQGAADGMHSHVAEVRHEVGAILASGVVPVTEIRVGPVIGSGSRSFEMVRSLTEVSPILLAPRWVRNECQPVGVRDVIEALSSAAIDDSALGRVVELGGPEVLTFLQMMKIYADEAGLRKRRAIPVPMTAARLSSLWAGLVTPLPARVARPLIEDLRSGLVPESPEPLVDDPTPYRVALRRALSRLPGGVITRWSDAESHPPAPEPNRSWRGEVVYMDRQVVPTDAETEHLFWAFSRIGGSVGYYGLDWAWRIRGLLDRAVGGPGLRRGRRHPNELRVGEVVDCWRVEEVEPGRRLRLRGELKMPGEAWLEWETRDTEFGADLIQTAWFRPRRWRGRAYWYGMLAAHRIVFPRMARRIAAAAEERGYSTR